MKIGTKDRSCFTSQEVTVWATCRSKMQRLLLFLALLGLTCKWAWVFSKFLFYLFQNYWKINFLNIISFFLQCCQVLRFLVDSFRPSISIPGVARKKKIKCHQKMNLSEKLGRSFNFWLKYRTRTSSNQFKSSEISQI